MRSDDPRLMRLRALIGKLERLPASAQRERALSEARARVVDVETGEIPRVMRPVDEPAPDSRGRRQRPPAEEPVPEPKPKPTRASARRERAQVIRRPPVEPAPPAPPGPPAAAHEVAIGSDGLLWLEDQPAEDPGPGGGDNERAPWRRGLRG